MHVFTYDTLETLEKHESDAHSYWNRVCTATNRKNYRLYIETTLCSVLTREGSFIIKISSQADCLLTPRPLQEVPYSMG